VNDVRLFMRKDFLYEPSKQVHQSTILFRYQD